MDIKKGSEVIEVSEKKKNWFIRLIHKPNPWVVRIGGTLIASGIIAIIPFIWSVIAGIKYIIVKK